MTKVTGIGGVFFKAQAPDKLRDWYRQHLGIESDSHGATFQWRHLDQPGRVGKTIWSPFPHDTGYFNPSEKPFMFNYRVANLDALLAELRNAGVAVDDRIEEYEYGRFAWIMDPEGNRIELWEPAEGW
jgi:predicted enzyme related to lactoylglutathione lyase